MIHRLSIGVKIYTVLAIISFVIVSLLFAFSKNDINITVETIQLFCALVSLFGILVCMLKSRELQLQKMVLQSLICFVLGQLYWVLHIYIRGFEQIGVISISDISWLGFYFFLLAAYRATFHPKFNFKDSKYIKINIVSLLAPAFIIGVNTALFLSGDSLLYAVAYTIPTSLLAYDTQRMILLSFKEKGVKNFRGYHIVVFLILILDNSTCLAMNYGFLDAEYIFKFCFALIILVIPPTLYKGVSE